MIKQYFFILYFRDEWIISNLGRVCLVSSSVWWTAEMEDVLDQLKRGKRNAMKDYFNTQQLKLQAILDKLNEGKYKID